MNNVFSYSPLVQENAQDDVPHTAVCGATLEPPYIIGLAAPLIKEQRIIDALWVFETLNHIPLDYQAYIIGDGKERDYLLRCRDGWKLSSRVRFLGSSKNALQHIRLVHVLLHLGTETADCYAVRDAVAMKIPVIASDTSKTRQLVKDGVNGILIPDCGDDFRLRRRLFAKRTLRFFRPVL
ncbi:MAG: glycosyltransferase [Planctomycetaceae bacterium]|jgi:glycosyltransferase involved in cell wall biosynthesis|nr:glycosyltransferase [Planctomycetaceae bacterium]